MPAQPAGARIGGGIGVGGYFLAETGLILLGGGTWQAAVGGAVLGILPNTIQEIVGGSAYILVAAALDRPDVKKRLTKW